jgi:hypothetical protein
MVLRRPYAAATPSIFADRAQFSARSAGVACHVHSPAFLERNASVDRCETRRPRHRSNDREIVPRRRRANLEPRKRDGARGAAPRFLSRISGHKCAWRRSTE